MNVIHLQVHANIESYKHTYTLVYLHAVYISSISKLVANATHRLCTVVFDHLSVHTCNFIKVSHYHLGAINSIICMSSMGHEVGLYLAFELPSSSAVLLASARTCDGTLTFKAAGSVASHT